MYNFEAVIGNEHIVNALQGTIEQGRVNHAICITGKPGTGRKLISRAYAKALQCEARQGTMQIAMIDAVQEVDSCGVCASCVSFEGGTHPDIFQIRPEKSSIGVDVVREQIVQRIRLFIVQNSVEHRINSNTRVPFVLPTCGHSGFREHLHYIVFATAR